MLQTSFISFGPFSIDHIRNSSKNDMRVQHYHDSYEIYLQISGERYLFLDDICYTLKPGDIYILNPFVVHYTKSREVDYYERYVMNFYPEKLSILLNSHEIQQLFKNFDTCVLHLNEKQANSIYADMKRIDSYTKQKGLFSEKLVYSAVFQLLIVLKELSEHSETVTTQMIPNEIVNAIRYINKNYQSNIDLDSLAEIVHLSKYHFCHLFHQATGATFLKYLYNIRLSKVHQMLIETELSLGEIADRAGFSSTAHMTRIFKQVYKVSPREFRKSAQKNAVMS